MYYFPNLDEQTRLNMISELKLDIRTGMFYNPVSMTDYSLMNYKRVYELALKEVTSKLLLTALHLNTLSNMIITVVKFHQIYEK